MPLLTKISSTDPTAMPYVLPIASSRGFSLFDLPAIKPLSQVYFIGDSNTLLYRHLSVDLPDRFPRRIATNCCFVPALSAASIMKDGTLNGRIIEYFVRELLVQFKERYRRYAAFASAEEWTWLRDVMPPLEDIYNVEEPLAIVIMIGTIDLGVLAGNLGPNVDFIVEDPRFVEASFAGPDLPIVPVGIVRTLVEKRLAPLGDALRSLVEIGFKNVYVHSLHPPTTDDVRYFRARQTMSSSKLRYKLVILINQSLERIARESGVEFLDMWDETVVDGIVDPRLDLDGDHLNQVAVDLTLKKLLNDLARRSGEPFFL